MFAFSSTWNVLLARCMAGSPGHSDSNQESYLFRNLSALSKHLILPSKIYKVVLSHGTRGEWAQMLRSH